MTHPAPGPVTRGPSAQSAYRWLGIAIAVAVVVAVVATVLALVGIPVKGSAGVSAGPAGTAGGPFTASLPTQPVQRWTAAGSDVFGSSAHDIGYTSSGGGIAVLGAHTDGDNQVMAVNVADGRPHWPRPTPVPNANGCWVTDFGDVLCKSSSLGDDQASVYFISGTDGSIRKQIRVPAGLIDIAAVDSTWIVYVSAYGSDATDVYGYGPDGTQRWHVGGDLYQTPLVSRSTGLVAIQNSSQGQVVRGTDGHVVYSTGGRSSGFNRITMFYNGFAVSSIPSGGGPNEVALYDAGGRQVTVNRDDWQATSQTNYDPFSASFDCSGVVVYQSTASGKGETLGVLDPVSGKLLWRTTLDGGLRNDRCNGDRVFSIPIDNGYSDTVFDLRSGHAYGTIDLVSSDALMGSDGKSAVYRISSAPGSHTVVAIAAFDLTTLQKVWTYPLDSGTDWNLDDAGLWKINTTTISRYTSG
ncbi:outer membrane protein assembly factor BamB family protein [Jongsikchunia kroppenstedtii]|uniref:outer membrane protein assembly factor BamB family protein n=1 Tax=Jongsikchunia kroppenstedtii TaxID=1121721 RepID=UPI0003A8CA25|nr:PQQ-binding-like beta-propeller repeat protein [Jongsikchunia kroppenstedtii]